MRPEGLRLRQRGVLLPQKARATEGDKECFPLRTSNQQRPDMSSGEGCLSETIKCTSKRRAIGRDKDTDVPPRKAAERRDVNRQLDTDASAGHCSVHGAQPRWPRPPAGDVCSVLYTPVPGDTRGPHWFGDGQGECELSTGRVRVPPQGLCRLFPALPREMIIVSERLAGLEPWTAGPSWQTKRAWLWGTAAPRANMAAASWWVQRDRLGSAPSPSSLLCTAFSVH